MKQGSEAEGAGFDGGGSHRWLRHRWDPPLFFTSFSRASSFLFPIALLTPPPPLFPLPPHQNTTPAPLRSKRFITLSDSGGAAEDVALPGLAGVGRVELAIEEAAEEARRGEAELEEVGGTKGSERVRPRAALFLTDIGSEALVLVDGQPLAKRERRRLRPGSVLSFRRPSQQQEGGGEGGEEFFELFRDEKAHA